MKWGCVTPTRISHQPDSVAASLAALLVERDSPGIRAFEVRGLLAAADAELADEERRRPAYLDDGERARALTPVGSDAASPALYGARGQKCATTIRVDVDASEVQIFEKFGCSCPVMFSECGHLQRSGSLLLADGADEALRDLPGSIAGSST